MVGNLTSHGGLVMHSATSYVIFWLPSGYHFDTPLIDQNYPNASDQNYEALVVQFLRDLSNTAYYSIVQQYTDSSGAPGLVTSLGGSWTDTSPYPNSEGTRANPLQASDLQAEVTKAMSANNWPSRFCSWREKVINVRLTAFSISSMQIRITSGLRRTSTPTVPRVNRTAPRRRNQEVSSCEPPIVRVLTYRRSLCG